MNHLDWSLLKKPLLLLLLVLVVMGAVAGLLWTRYEDTHHRYQGAVSERDDALARYRRAASDLQLFAQYRERFLDYRRRGVIGKENRLSWAEALHQQYQELGLGGFDVEISPRQATQFGNSPPTIKWFKSTQKIKAGMLHEGDLYRILGALHKQAEGLFRVASCDLRRGKAIALTPQAQNVQAECQLEWYSMEISQPVEEHYGY